MTHAKTVPQCHYQVYIIAIKKHTETQSYSTNTDTQKHGVGHRCTVPKSFSKKHRSIVPHTQTPPIVATLSRALLRGKTVRAVNRGPVAPLRVSSSNRSTHLPRACHTAQKSRAVHTVELNGTLFSCMYVPDAMLVIRIDRASQQQWVGVYPRN